MLPYNIVVVVVVANIVEVDLHGAIRHFKQLPFCFRNLEFNENIHQNTVQQFSLYSMTSFRFQVIVYCDMLTINIQNLRDER